MMLLPSLCLLCLAVCLMASEVAAGLGHLFPAHRDNCPQAVRKMKEMDGNPPPRDIEYPECDRKGNYEMKQCYAKWTSRGVCACFHPITGVGLSGMNVTSSRGFNAQSMTCQCAAHYLNSPEDRARYCDLKTGDYKPVTCMGNTCRCAHRSGAQMMQYHLFKFDENSNLSNCHCARKEADYRQGRLIGLSHICDEYGAFKPVQCTGSECYCVDKQGDKTTTNTVPIGSDAHRNMQC